MEIKATLHNLRIAPRKVRLVANLIKKMPAAQAKGQLTFLTRKPAPLILKLLNSGIANAKHNFGIDESQLVVKNVLVEAGSTLKRWLPRAQGRATPLRKRTCSVKLILEATGQSKETKKSQKPVVVKEKEVMPAAVEKQEEIIDQRHDEMRPKAASVKGFKENEKGKKQAPRQGWGNIKKAFRRKSI